MSAFLISWQLQYKANVGKTGDTQRKENKGVKEKGLCKLKVGERDMRVRRIRHRGKEMRRTTEVWDGERIRGRGHRQKGLH